MSEAPLILTLRMDHSSFETFNRQRLRHFPPDRNFIPAHLTLFHHLPGRLLEEITQELRTRCASEAPFSLLVPRLMSLGAGVAYAVESPDLLALRADLAGRWAAHLTRQDASGFRPHVTVQNKVPAKVARDTYERLASAFTPFQASATGLLLWRYRGGPWDLASELAFGG